jgi:lipopolysaccharide export system protein LptC
MELIILLVVVVAAIGWFIWSERQHDKNGTHPLDSVTTPSTPSTPTTTTTPTSVLDVNKDGKVDIKDAVAAVEVVKEEVKTVAKKQQPRQRML